MADNNPIFSNGSVEDLQVSVLIQEYNKGMRLKNLDREPALWVVEGLKILESGQTLTKELLLIAVNGRKI